METTSNSPVILITGGSSGIGEATARLFASKGYRIALAARRFERLENIADEIRSQACEVLVIPTDVTVLKDIQNMVETTIAEYGRIDVLFNNAGFGRIEPLVNLDPVKDIKSQVDVNLLGLIHTAQAVLPYMIKARYGHIINMSSIAGLMAPPTYSVYSATKYGVRGFTEALRREMRPYGVKVSGMYPGWVRTEFSQIARIDPKSGVLTPQFLRMESVQVARAVWSLVLRPRRRLAFPWLLALAVIGAELFPTIADWVIAVIFRQREQKKR